MSIIHDIGMYAILVSGKRKGTDYISYLLLLGRFSQMLMSPNVDMLET